LAAGTGHQPPTQSGTIGRPATLFLPGAKHLRTIGRPAQQHPRTALASPGSSPNPRSQTLALISWPPPVCRALALGADLGRRGRPGHDVSSPVSHAWFQGASTKRQRPYSRRFVNTTESRRDLCCSCFNTDCGEQGMARPSQNNRRHPIAIKQTPIARTLLHPPVTRQGFSK